MSNSASDGTVRQSTQGQARALRRNLTPAESALWRILRDRRLAQTKWRRQFPFGPYIVDFVCLEHCVIVECDGSQHAKSARDVLRDAWLASQGFQVVRFWNHDVLGRCDSVVDTILARCGLPF